MSSIKYVPESLDGVVKVRYSKIGGKNVPVDIVIMFEVMPQGAVDYIVKNWKEILTAKAIYASSTRAAIGDFATMNIKNVVGGEDNIIVVTIDVKSLDDLFFSTDIHVAANLRLSVKMNGSESISSDYLPLSPLLSYDQIIEYTTVTGDRMDYDGFFRIKKNYSDVSLVDGHIGNVWRIIIDDYPAEKNLFGCEFNRNGYYTGKYNHDLKSLSFVTPIELKYLSFIGCDGLNKVDLSNVNTENVTTMRSMFCGCKSLTGLDLSSFDTRNVTNMHHMFGDSESLTNLDLSSFDTKSVTDMSFMFLNCDSLTSLDLSSFDTRNLTIMYGMFSGCESLTSLDLSSFDTRNVTDMAGMSILFEGCKSLTSLDLSSFDTRNVTDMSRMFSGCESLTSLDLSSFDTRNVTNMNRMFCSCKSLTSLDLSSFDTKNVTNMDRMFLFCNSMTRLNLSNFSINGNFQMDYMMFTGCMNLKEIIMRGCDKKTIEMISKVKPRGAVIITD